MKIDNKYNMKNNMKHIKEHTYVVEVEQVKKIGLNKNGSIDVWFGDTNETWRGALQGVVLDDKGETLGYEVYVY